MVADPDNQTAHTIEADPEEPHFVQLGDEFVMAPGLTDAEFRLYVILRRFAWDVSGKMCFPSQPTLAAAMGKKDPRSVREAMSGLITKGCVVLVKRGDGRGHSNHYRVVSPLKMPHVQAYLNGTTVETSEKPERPNLTLMKAENYPPFIGTDKGGESCNKGGIILPPKQTNKQTKKATATKSPEELAKTASKQAEQAQAKIDALPENERADVAAVFGVPAFAPFSRKPTSVDTVHAVVQRHPEYDFRLEALNAAAYAEGRGRTVKAISFLSNWIENPNQRHVHKPMSASGIDMDGFFQMGMGDSRWQQ